MILYHGSKEIVEFPEIRKAVYNKDFYFGFYCTRMQEQAERWATRYGRKGYVNCYEYIPDKKLKYLIFEEMTEEWLDFIVASRNGEKPWMKYDMIEGGVANDRVIDTVEDYMDGTITVEQAIGQLKFTKPNHQICLLNQSLIDDFLHYVKSFQLQ